MDSHNDTTRQRVLAYIKAYSNERRIMPSVREIREGLGLRSTNTVSYNINKLAEAGELERIPGIARGIVLPEREGE